jgi:GrpB-like predicted nucleotidyltransferase (UPF0157 family)
VPISVTPYCTEWPAAFERTARVLIEAHADVPSAVVEHVGSTAVPGLAAKPILDIEVIVSPGDVAAAVRALESIGYVHQGELGLAGREAFSALDDDAARHVYVCHEGTLHVRNRLAVRDVLRRRDDLRDEYCAVKRALAADVETGISSYIACKSRVFQKVLAESDLTEEERDQIQELNRRTARAGNAVGRLPREW